VTTLGVPALLPLLPLLPLMVASIGVVSAFFTVSARINDHCKVSDCLQIIFSYEHASCFLCHPNISSERSIRHLIFYNP